MFLLCSPLKPENKYVCHRKIGNFGGDSEQFLLWQKYEPENNKASHGFPWDAFSDSTAIRDQAIPPSIRPLAILA